MKFTESSCQHMKNEKNLDCQGTLPENWKERNVCEENPDIIVGQKVRKIRGCGSKKSKFCD